MYMACRRNIHPNSYLCYVGGMYFVLCNGAYTAQSICKAFPHFVETGIEFAFHDDSFLTVQTGDIAKGTAITRYDALNKVYETKTMFYIYITPMQALLIAKCDITKGTPEELRNILITKLPAKKYIICK